MDFFGDRQEIISRANKLRGSNYYINEDFSATTEKERRQLYPVLKAARQKEEYKGQVALKVDRLTIKGKTYTVDNMADIPADINPQKLATDTSVPGMVRFYTKASPLSNFHDSPFTIDGIKYSHVEQYYQAGKARHFNDDKTESQIMAANDPYKMFTLGQNVKNFDENMWRQQCNAVMEKAVLSKFSTNKKLCDSLLETGDSIIAECGPDKYWGTGMRSSDPRSRSKDTWTGENHLGEILMKVRDQLRK